MRAARLVAAVCAACAALSHAATVDRQTFETEDAVIIEGAGGLTDSVRVGRQTTNLLEKSQTVVPPGWLEKSQTVVPPGWPGLPAGVTDTCDTRDGRVGRCLTRAACYWTRSLPTGERSLERSLGPCLAGGLGRDASGVRRPLVRGVCCPGLFSEATTESMAAPTTTTTTAAPTTNRASTTRPAATQWWQTTYQSTSATTATATTSTTITSTSTTTARPRPSVPTIPPIITHPWQGSSSTTSTPTTTAWWQTTPGPAESATTSATTTTTRRGPTTTAWWQTTTATTEKPSTAASTGAASVSPEANAQYSRCGRRNYNAGADEDRIVGGVEAQPGEFPWIAGIFKGKRQFCGGSLIDETHILTAAHCVAHMTSYDVRRLVVRLGDHDIKRDDEANHDEYSVARIIRHKGFSDQTLHTDIALLTLSKKVTYRDNIRPICLVSDDAVRYTGENVTVAGWGSLSEAGRQPSTLQKVTLKVWENSKCAGSYGKSAPGGIIRSMLCAASSGKDSCSGDSGGPLMQVKNGVVYQVGVVSWGIGCAKPEYPGVYTRVTSLKDWIKRNKDAY